MAHLWEEAGVFEGAVEWTSSYSDQLEVRCQLKHNVVVKDVQCVIQRIYGQCCGPFETHLWADTQVYTCQFFTMDKSKVPDQNGIFQLYNMLKIIIPFWSGTFEIQNTP